MWAGPIATSVPRLLQTYILRLQADRIICFPSIPDSNISVQPFHLLASFAILIAKILCTGNL